MNWLTTLWSWIAETENQKTLSFIAGGLAILVGAVWRLYVHFSKKRADISPLIDVGRKGVGAGHDIVANASAGGTAIVATGDVNVSHVRPEDVSEVIARAETHERDAQRYLREGDMVNAELFLKESLEVLKKGLGPDNANVARSLAGLAWFYYKHDVRQRDKAEPLFKQALAMGEKALGPDHLEVSGLLDGLADLYRDEGRYTEVEPLYQRSLGICEKAIGQDSDDRRVLRTREKLAELYYSQGRHSEAETLYEHSVKVLSKHRVSGADLEPALTIHKLANTYRDHHRYMEAEESYKRAIGIHEDRGRDRAEPYFVSLLADYDVLLRKLNREPGPGASGSRLHEDSHNQKR